MSAQTPGQKLAAIRKTIADAKREERKAVLDLPREEWNRDYEWRKGHTLSGSKTVDVDVDFEIEKEDLEALGYHHEDDCNGSSLDPDDGDANRRALSDWHDHAHGLSLWAGCVYEPCNLLTAEFRKTP